IAGGVPRELPVEGERAAGRHFGEVLEFPELRLQAETNVVRALDPAGRVGDAEDVLRRTLGNGAFALAAEPGQREVRTSVVDRIGTPRQILEADVAHPVAVVEADRRVEVVGVVVAEAR